MDYHVSMSTVKLIRIALGRPSVAKAVLWSLGLHVAAAAATSHSWTQPAHELTLTGMRNVVQIEAAFSAERSECIKEPDFLTAQSATPPKPREDAIEPVLVSLTKPQLRLPPVEPERNRIETPKNSRSQVAQDVIRRETVDPRLDQTAPPAPHLPRRDAKQPVLLTSVRAEQVAGVDDRTPPDFQGNRPPKYPAMAVSHGMEGTVLLRLHIAATGHVRRVEIVTSSGHEILDCAAVEAVSKWRGRPASLAGTASATVELLPIRFRL